jgi:hypothetical protein
MINSFRALERGDNPLCLKLRIGEGDGKLLLPREQRDPRTEIFCSPYDKRARPESLGRQGQREKGRAVCYLANPHQARLVRHGAAVAELVDDPPVAPDRRAQMAPDDVPGLVGAFRFKKLRRDQLPSPRTAAQRRQRRLVATRRLSLQPALPCRDRISGAHFLAFLRLTPYACPAVFPLLVAQVLQGVATQGTSQAARALLSEPFAVPGSKLRGIGPVLNAQGGQAPARS